uniref:Uncharacterized protein n=1 Tax=Panagrellus redivivus TaxID=6233 RepID=A0A7E4VLG4_PANRE
MKRASVFHRFDLEAKSKKDTRASGRPRQQTAASSTDCSRRPQHPPASDGIPSSSPSSFLLPSVSSVARSNVTNFVKGAFIAPGDA